MNQRQAEIEIELYLPCHASAETHLPLVLPVRAALASIIPLFLGLVIGALARHELQHDRGRQLVVCLPAALRGFKDVDRVPGTGRLVRGGGGHRCTSTIVTHQVGDSG